MKTMSVTRFLVAGVIGTTALCLVGCDSGGGGGTGASGSGTTTGATGATGATTGGSSGGTFVADGYISVGSWKGYGYTVGDTLKEGTTVTPDCSSGTCVPAFSGNVFEMSGSVAPDMGYNGFALLGWNVNQDSGTDTPINAWPVPASGGVTITFDNIDNAPTRLQLEIPNADVNGRYCATLTSGVPLKWSDLKTTCYTTGGTALAAGTMIKNAAVQVYGTNTTAVSFDIKITDITIQ